MKKKKIFAFTLAEVLITLSILGVVAAITVPSLINKNTEKQTVTKLKKEYSALATAYDVALAEMGTDPASWYADTGKYVPEIIVSYLNIDKICTHTDKTCASTDTYKILSGNNWIEKNFYSTYFQKSLKYVLHDGASVAVWIDSNVPTCNSNYCGAIFVDINGKSKPNQLGIDLFSFNINKKGISPHGSNNGTLSIAEMNEKLDKTCNKASTNNDNGKSCTAWAIYKGNMDYKRKTVSW